MRAEGTMQRLAKHADDLQNSEIQKFDSKQRATQLAEQQAEIEQGIKKK